MANLQPQNSNPEIQGQHHAMWDYWPRMRSGHRGAVKGDRPI